MINYECSARVGKMRLPEMMSHLAAREFSGESDLKERQAVVFPVTVFRLCLVDLRSLVRILSELCCCVLPVREIKRSSAVCKAVVAKHAPACL